MKRIKRFMALGLAAALMLSVAMVGSLTSRTQVHAEAAVSSEAEASDEPSEALDRIATDFEDGTVQGWQPRGGSVLLSASGDAAYSGEYGLKVEGRTQGWNGPTFNVTSFMQVGKTYGITAWVRLPAGSSASSVAMLVERTTDGTAYYESVTSKTATDSGWVKLSGEYTLKNPVSNAGVYFESFDNPTLSFYVDEFVIERVPDPIPIEIEQDIPNLKDVFADDFLLGAALLANEIADAEGPDAQLVKKHFNSLTAGNEMKWDATEPVEGQFTFANADKIVGFAEENGIAVRGHTLIWHSQTPNWVFYDENGNLASKELLFARMKSHIDEVVGRYKGKIYAWDVVNEVIEPGDRKPNGLRNSLWYQIAGEEFIEKAFEYAHAADPDAVLYINDYNTHFTDKRQFIYDLIKRLQDKGIPVQGVGHQTHIGIASPSIQELDDMLAAFRDLGIEQQVTELDMSVYTNDAESYESFPLELQIKQAKRYQAIFEVFKKHADQLTAVIFWGKDDLNTWLRTFPVDRNNWPLLFDERLQAKYAYWALVDPSKVPVETQKAAAVAGTVKVDGNLDDTWKSAKPVTIQSEGSAVASYRTQWSSGQLHLWVDVMDTTVNGNDAVEVFIDENNGKTTSYEADDMKYTFLRSGANPHKPAEYKAVKSATGYVIEASIPLASAALAQTIGFDIRIADRSGSDTALTSWNDIHHKQDADTSGFGELELIEGPRLAKAVSGTPVIDGDIDGIWTCATALTTDRWVQGTSGSSAKVRTLWDGNRLYVLAEVTDSLLTKRSANVWEQDSVEIFLDQNNARTNPYDADDGQYRINFDNEQSVSPGSSSGRLVSAAKLTDNGYIVEASIAWTGTPPMAGSLIGFDVQVNNDQDDDGVRDSIAIWNDMTGMSWQNLSEIGLLEIMK
ncbi:endo-1,4-beta-xylanase [Paenibacillus harenae]|uniref:endo-1,4-beta-xylanase n=1 Tax=Paenibacillus harenae TaxID=306543 RepID=UPI002793AB0F|nr:endo-1,4-beta-xylanase [Paenibacillus harenae]MDQ0059098.1 endo-1,4-beta-xylanase [Paenibacillus harenae]